MWVYPANKVDSLSTYLIILLLIKLSIPALIYIWKENICVCFTGKPSLGVYRNILPSFMGKIWGLILVNNMLSSGSCVKANRY